jgi:membrane protease YdiL (CAAX protease family)
MAKEKTSMASESSSAVSHFSVNAPSKSPSLLEMICKDPNAIRSGWPFLIYFVLVLIFRQITIYAFGHIGPVTNWLRSQPTTVITAGPLILLECASFLQVLLAALLMVKIEKRPFGEYGLPVKQAFGRRFWQGVPFGFAMMSLLMALIGVLHGYTFEGISARGADMFKYAILYAIGFLFVGFFEEYAFRGFAQAKLGAGLGFWPSALVLSFFFGFIHLGNSGEANIGAFMAGSFGLLALFTLKRTGSLWFAVGMHAAFDWTETYFYGVPDSGLLAQGHLLGGSFHGPDWLTGGTVGPEGSYLVFVVLVASAVAIHFMFPAKENSQA